MSSILADTPTVASLADTIIQKQPQETELAIIGELLAEVTNMTPEEIEAYGK